MQPLEKRLETIERLLRDLLKENKKDTWVKASTIMEITKWKDKEALRRARDRGHVKVRRNGGAIWYSVESVSEIFLHKQNA